MQGWGVVTSTRWDVRAVALLSGQPDDKEAALFDFWHHHLTLLLYSKLYCLPSPLQLADKHPVSPFSFTTMLDPPPTGTHAKAIWVIMFMLSMPELSNASDRVFEMGSHYISWLVGYFCTQNTARCD
jgi:hypothetical protein